MNAFVCAPNGARIRTRTRSKNNRTGVVRFAVSAVVRTDWKPSSWREKATVDAGVPLTEVSRLPPLVYSGEVDRLKSKLADVQTGKAFLLKAGDREEDFTITQGENTEATFRLLVAQVIMLAYVSGVPIVKVNHIGGDFENIGPLNVSSDEEVLRVTKSYYQSSSALNLLRALAKSPTSMMDWTDPISTVDGETHKDLIGRVEDALRFVQAAGLNVFNEDFREPEFYVSHELFLLPYEEALTRSVDGQWYGSSTHMYWMTRGSQELDEAHIEYLRGVENPVSIRVDTETSEASLVEIIKTLNPSNEPGKVVLTCSFGSSKIWGKLPKMIRAVTEAGMNVVWVCDPMRENTIPTENGCLTCPVELIWSEIASFFNVHSQEGTYAGGVFLEMTGSDVSECVGGVESIRDSDVCCEAGPDALPRLNPRQALSVAIEIGRLLKAVSPEGRTLKAP
mmetsp:Transcript_1324/g.3901  ORF Transcript_1324/g.3901 Transcript_1324/m.3901 type:complete len:451 (-) Transcript_1324:377-1729(-)